MNRPTVSSMKMAPTSDDAKPNTLPATFVANPARFESALRSCCSIVAWEISTLNQRSVYLLTVSTMSGAASISALSWSMISGIIEATITTENTMTPNKITPVASPRRQPRRASQSTAGSRANDANSATRIQVSKLESCRSTDVTVVATSHVTKIRASKDTIHRHGGGWITTGMGARSSSDGAGSGVGSSSSVIVSPGPAEDTPGAG